ncbi:MAG TPA: LOG family protein [Anaerolineaceae bacterium]|nr:LOG family protein [Anaerolineaceae bacterium]
MNVTVFGGASPKPGQLEYLQALRLGRLLAEGGYTVLTGGYMGTMEAVSRGAAEAGGHTIGVTCDEIERWRASKANPWVQEVWSRPTLTDRLVALMDSSDAFIALPGGPGTLTEISLAWNRMVIEALSPRPLIVIGPGWRSVFSQLFTAQDSNIAEAYRRLLTFVDNVDQAAELLKNGNGHQTTDNGK